MNDGVFSEKDNLAGSANEPFAVALVVCQLLNRTTDRRLLAVQRSTDVMNFVSVRRRGDSAGLKKRPLKIV